MRNTLWSNRRFVSLRRRSALLGRLDILEERLAPAGLDGHVEVPALPGLARLDAALAGAILRQWYVPAGTQSARWVVQLNDQHDPSALDSLRAKVTPVAFLDDVYVLHAPAPQDIEQFGRQIAAANLADWFYPLVPVQQQKRFIPNDTFFGDQWHLRNTGQSSGTPGEDARLATAWDQTAPDGTTPIRGTGVIIGVVDDGLQHTHPDLSPNYVAAHSFDFNDNDADPAPDPSFDAHGTAAAGVAAARGDNGLGVSGSAPLASLAGLRLIAGPTDDALEAAALGYHSPDIAIYSNSWGPSDNGQTLEGPGPITLSALANGYNSGRGGLGNIYVWAAGNGRGNNDNVNYDGYANSRYVIAVAAVDHEGVQSSYSEPGAAILVTAPSSGAGVGITTTDLTGSSGYNGGSSGPADANYTNDFGGTSSATPLVAGVVALMLQANPSLTARDVQHILANSARKNHPTDAGWTNNAAGLHVNHKYGFGAIDANAAVALAKTWVSVGPQSSTSSGSIVVNQAIPNNDATGISSTFNVTSAFRAEHIEVVLNASHTARGDLEIILTSPSGTTSTLAAQHNDLNNNYSNWVFTSVRHWNEPVTGTWTVTVKDRASGGNVGTWIDWELRVFGSSFVAPTIENLEASALTYLENQTLPLTATLAINAAGALELGSATVSISANYVPGQDELHFTNQNGISGSFTNGVLTLTGNASVPSYQSALRSIRYHNTSDNPSTALRTISFTVRNTAGTESLPATRDVIVIRVNDAPSFTAGADQTVFEDPGPINVPGWATNISTGPEETDQSVSFEIVSNSNAALFSAGPAVAPDGDLTFTPAANSIGSAVIGIRIRDNGGTANGGVDTGSTATFAINVEPINDAPVALPDHVYVPEDNSIVISPSVLLANDEDVDGDPLTTIKVSDPAHGSVVVNPDGSFTYQPLPDYFGVDVFTYVANDGEFDSAPAAIFVHVTPVPDPPTANDDSVTTASNKPITIAVLDNDTDPDGDFLRIQSYSRPALGRLARLGSALVYRPLPNAQGTDQFTYIVVDATGQTDSATVSVNLVDNAPPRVTGVRLGFGARTIELAAFSRAILPWANVTRLQFVFSEPVQLSATPIGLQTIGGVAVAFATAYEPATRTLTVNLATPLAAGAYNLRLFANQVADPVGNGMVRDWQRTFGVLPGDFDGNGIVNEADLRGIKRNYSKPRKPYNPFADIDGTGFIDVKDYSAANKNNGKRL